MLEVVSSSIQSYLQNFDKDLQDFHQKKMIKLTVQQEGRSEELKANIEIDLHNFSVKVTTNDAFERIFQAGKERFEADRIIKEEKKRRKNEDHEEKDNQRAENIQAMVNLDESRREKAKSFEDAQVHAEYGDKYKQEMSKSIQL